MLGTWSKKITIELKFFLKMFFYTRFFVLLIGVISLNTLIISCDLVSSDDEDDEEEQETIIREETVAIEPEDAPILEREDDRLIFELTDATPEIEVDNIIVGEEDGGFLRKAASVEIEDDRVVVETEEASLVDAIESGSLSESLDPSNAQGQDIRWEIKDKAEGVELQSEPQDLQWRYTLEDVDIASQIEGISVGLSDGEVSFTPQMHLDFDISLGRIEEFRLSQEGTLEFHTDIGIIAGDDMSISDDYSLITFQTQPVVYFIGWVPVTVRYIMDFVASYDIGLDSTTELSTGIETSNSIEIGARYNQEWERITEWQEESDYRGFEWQEPEFEAEGYVTVRPELSVSFYEALGPFINAGPYLEAMASISPFDWSWLLIAGLDTEFGGTLEILDYELASYSYTHTIWEDQLGSDEGEEQPDEYEIEVEVYGQGSVDKEPGRSTYTHGEEVTLTADPDQDWEFDEWNGDLDGSENPKTIKVTGDMWVEAEFVERDDGDRPGDIIYEEDFSSEPGYTIAKSSTDDGSDLRWDEEQENYFIKTVDGSGSGEWWVFSGSPLFSEIGNDNSFTVSFKFNPVQPDWGSYPGLRFVEDDSEVIEGSEVETEWGFRLDCRDSSGCSSFTEDTHSRFRLDLGGGEHFHSPRISDLDAWYEVTINYDGLEGAAEILILKEDGSVFVEETGLPLMGTESSFNRILLGRRSSGPPEYGDTSVIRVDEIVISNITEKLKLN